MKRKRLLSKGIVITLSTVMLLSSTQSFAFAQEPDNSVQEEVQDLENGSELEKSYAECEEQTTLQDTNESLDLFENKTETEIENETNDVLEIDIEKNGLVENEESLFYYDENGMLVTSEWRELPSGIYYFGEDGVAVDGWQVIDGEDYYFKECKLVKGGCLMIDGNLYNFEADGKLHKGWKDSGNVRFYFDESGVAVDGWQVIDGEDYYFKGRKLVKGGCLMIDGNLYNFGPEGVMHRGWKDSGNVRFYFNESGVAVDGWQVIDGEDYYFKGRKLVKGGCLMIGGNLYNFGADGVMNRGWKDSGNVRFYFNESGVAVDGWQVIEGEEYYFNGRKLAKGGCLMIGGNLYNFEVDGKVHKGWKDSGNVRFYFDENGRAVDGWQVIDGTKYCFANRKLLKGGCAVVDGKLYSFDENGQYRTGWIQIGTKWYYFEENGVGAPKSVFQISELEKKVNGIVNKYNGTKEVYFEDLKSGKSFSINDQRMYPCSVIKLSAMLGTYDQIEKGNLSMSACSNKLYNMMVHSDNTSYNSLMSMIGGGNPATGSKRVNQLLKDNGIYNTAANNGLLPGSGYYSSGVRNYTTPSDMGRLLSKIYNHEIISKSACDKMMDLMSKCADDRALRHGLPSGTRFAHKSGWADGYYLDGGIVFGPSRDYVIVVFTNNVSNRTKLFSEIQSTVYNYEKDAIEIPR